MEWLLACYFLFDSLGEVNASVYLIPTNEAFPVWRSLAILL